MILMTGKALFSVKTQGMNQDRCYVKTPSYSKAKTIVRPEKISEKSQDVKPHNSNSKKERLTSENSHHPFITKVQVRIRSTKSDFDLRTKGGSTSNVYRSRSCHRLETVAVRKNSSQSLRTGKNSYNECESSANSHSKLEQGSKLEQRVRRRMLGELALAPYIARETRKKEELLYQPRFSAKDCYVQLLLVRELTDHLICSSRNTRSPKFRNSQTSTVFHARTTKGEREFGFSR